MLLLIVKRRQNFFWYDLAGCLQPQDLGSLLSENRKNRWWRVSSVRAKHKSGVHAEHSVSHFYTMYEYEIMIQCSSLSIYSYRSPTQK